MNHYRYDNIWPLDLTSENAMNNGEAISTTRDKENYMIRLSYKVLIDCSFAEKLFRHYFRAGRSFFE